jgi:hypothetical protein
MTAVDDAPTAARDGVAEGEGGVGVGGGGCAGAAEDEDAVGHGGDVDHDGVDVNGPDLGDGLT